MLDMPLHTKDKILGLGRSYIQELGYHTFNYKQIALALNIKNAAIHHYYPSKEDLAVAVIEKDHEDFKQLKDVLASEAPLINIEALINLYKNHFTCGKLCVIGTFEAAINEVSERIKTAIANYLDDVIIWLRGIMQIGLDKGDFHFTQSPNVLAESWLATLPGSLMIGRLRGEKAFFSIMQQLKDTLEIN